MDKDWLITVKKNTNRGRGKPWRRPRVKKSPSFLENRPVSREDDDPTLVRSIPIDQNVTMENYAVASIPVEVGKGNVTVPKIPVVVWPYFEFGMQTAEALHITDNGIHESAFLELSLDPDNFDPNVVWVGDTGYAYGWNFWCHKFCLHVRAAKEKRQKLGLPLQWPSKFLFRFVLLVTCVN
jgi:hypothetical protein